MEPTAADSDTVFSSRFNRVLAIVIWALALVMVTTTVLAGGASGAFALVPGAFFAVFAWTALWRPHVRVSDAGVRICNVFRTIDIPWAALIQVDTRYALTLYTPGHQFAAWAAPAPGRTGTNIARRAQQSGRVGGGPTVDGAVRPGDLLASESGQAAHLVRERWHALLESGAVEVGAAEDTPVHVHWHGYTIVALLALGAGALVALVAL
ncbi:PH domain-containing protein [Parafrigoribacterium soli]|uniref:PH domain-containing protein n=1 Tax=Parafrigoribacterium soli TaxID=3144663 RepID=UPI0032EB8497